MAESETVSIPNKIPRSITSSGQPLYTALTPTHSPDFIMSRDNITLCPGCNKIEIVFLTLFCPEEFRIKFKCCHLLPEFDLFLLLLGLARGEDRGKGPAVL